MSLLRKNKEQAPEKISGFGKPAKYTSKYKIVAWFKNYWYYYKAPLIFILAALALVVWFSVDLLTKENPDSRFYIVSDTLLVSDQYTVIPEKLEPYLSDINADGKVIPTVTYLNLPKDPQDETGTYAYQQIITVFYDDGISLMLVDDYAYQYIAQSGGFAALSEYGVTGGMDEYRIPVRGTSFAEGTSLDLLNKDFYLVFRVCPENFEDNDSVQKLYSDMAVYAQKIADEYQSLSAGD